MKKRKTALVIIIVVIAVVLISMFHKFAIMVRSKEFLLNLLFVSDHDVIGVDISKYQGDVDMERLAEQNISFIYIKATEGSEAVDVCFADNWANATNSSLASGAYHFFSFDSDGETQARHYIDTVGDLDGHLIPAVDVEYYADKEQNPPEKEDVVRELSEYISILEDTYHVKPVIYSSRDIYSKYLKDDFSEYPRWVRNIYYPAFFDAGTHWMLWQYCEHIALDGYNGDETYIDLNVLRSGYELEDLIVE